MSDQHHVIIDAAERFTKKAAPDNRDALESLSPEQRAAVVRFVKAFAELVSPPADAQPGPPAA